jgi:hypothetical protein
MGCTSVAVFPLEGEPEDGSWRVAWQDNSKFGISLPSFKGDPPGRPPRYAVY